MSMLKRARAALTAALTGAAILATAVGGADAASAAVSLSPSPLIDAERSGHVIIHKVEQGVDIGAPSDGTRKIALEDQSGIPGVTYTARRIVSVSAGPSEYSLDLSTSEGWLNASNLEFDSDASAWTLEGSRVTADFSVDVRTASTGPVGGTYAPAEFTNLPLGIYLFEETEYPAEAGMSAPWVMTVPLTHPTESDSWLYEIHVYPKHSLTDVTKTVDDRQSIRAGDAIDWTITAGIPQVADPDAADGGAKFLPPAVYQIKDALDPRLAPDDIASVAVSLAGADDTSLLDTDYSHSWSAPSEGHGGELVVSFSSAGRARLADAISRSAAPRDVKVRVDVRTRLQSAVEGGLGDGLISSRARLYISADAVQNDSPIYSSEPVTKWGDIVIEKVDAIDRAKTLPGASFAVYAAESDALAGANAVEIDGTSVFTTGPDGTVRIAGLRFSEWSQNRGVSEGDDGWRPYWLVETRAPDGYELAPEPIEVLVDADSQSTVTQVANAAHNAAFVLPLTGSTGTWFFGAGGALLIGVGLLLSVRRKRPEGAIGE